MADLEQEYAGARVAICPVREGGGSKIKVIEAASYWRPVVGTSHSFRGFDGLDWNDLSSADDPNTFAEATIRLLTDLATADRQATKLRAWQRATYSRSAFIDKVKEDLGA